MLPITATRNVKAAMKMNGIGDRPLATSYRSIVFKFSKVLKGLRTNGFFLMDEDLGNDSGRVREYSKHIMVMMIAPNRSDENPAALAHKPDAKGPTIFAIKVQDSSRENNDVLLNLLSSVKSEA